MEKKLDELSGVSSWTLHDLRRTAASSMAEMKAPLHVIEFVLNHSTSQLSGIAGVYNRHQYLPEKKQALEDWGAYVAGSVEKAKAAE